MGASRATIARRASSARMFTAWAARDGVIDTDPGVLLASPKARRTLPDVLRVDEAAAVMDAASGDGSPHGLRAAAVVELLYATGARVSELCGLDIDDVDGRRRTVRLFGKGSKERTVPLGEPASAAVDAWLVRGRSRFATADSGPALLLGARGGPRTAGSGSRGGRSGTARASPHRGHPSSRGWRGPADRPGTARSRYARYNADLYPCVHRATEGDV
jgi:integrase/recombinase XerC